MDKKKIWILGGLLVVAIIIICTLLFLKSIPEKEQELPSYSTSNGGTISPLNNTANSVALNDDGTSVSDAYYVYKSKNGYSVQYNNKYIVDFGEKDYDFSIKNATNTVNVAIKNMDKTDGISSIETKEDWDGAMSFMLGECADFQKTSVNNMDALIAHYVLDLGNGTQTDMIFAMLIGDKYIYNYIYSAAMNANQAEANDIGNILYSIKEI